MLAAEVEVDPWSCVARRFDTSGNIQFVILFDKNNARMVTSKYNERIYSFPEYSDWIRLPESLKSIKEHIVENSKVDNGVKDFGSEAGIWLVKYTENHHDFELTIFGPSYSMSKFSLNQATGLPPFVDATIKLYVLGKLDLAGEPKGDTPDTPP